jgi:chemotaxis protein MotB
MISRGRIWFCLAALSACGPSANEVRLQHATDELHKDIADQQQYIADLKLRVQMVDARNRVLIDLVQGLTSSAGAQPHEAALQGQPQPAHASLQALDHDLEVLVASVQHSREDIEALRAQRQALADELAHAKRIIEESRAQEAKIAARVAVFREMMERLEPLIAQGALQVRIVKGRLVLQLAEAVLFASGDANLTTSGKTVLDSVARVLENIRERDFQVGGHTDSTAPRKGRFASNWQLSAVRALNVMLYLIDRGVPKAHLSAAAHADSEAIADESTPEGRQANRRTEIVLLPNLEELPDLAALSELLSKPDSAANPP